MEKLTEEQARELIDRVKADVLENKFIRMGQSLFNNLYAINPTLADSIRATNSDPFYNNELIGSFLQATVSDEGLLYIYCQIPTFFQK